jgi:Sulfatase-modifying factor enzyme 1
VATRSAPLSARRQERLSRSRTAWRLTALRRRPTLALKLIIMLNHSCCAPETRAASVEENDRRVMKGGSHVCAASYRLRYRPPARRGQAARSSTSHLGFRCVIGDS